MHKILIEDIEFEPNKTINYEFDEFMEEFGSKISANLEFKSLGEFIKVTGNAQGKLKLTCDRCLNEFDCELNIKINEMFAKRALQDEYTQEFELLNGQFIEDLNGEKEIDVYDLLYQSVTLALPNKKVCGINCNESMFTSDEEMTTHDDRMDIFKTIKIERRD